jgi:hypothetical protein
MHDPLTQRRHQHERSRGNPNIEIIPVVEGVDDGGFEDGFAFCYKNAELGCLGGKGRRGVQKTTRLHSQIGFLGRFIKVWGWEVGFGDLLVWVITRSSGGRTFMSK